MNYLRPSHQPVSNNGRVLPSPLIIDLSSERVKATGVSDARNISSSGLYLTTRIELSEGARLTFLIPLGDEQIVARGASFTATPGAASVSASNTYRRATARHYPPGHVIIVQDIRNPLPPPCSAIKSGFPLRPTPRESCGRVFQRYRASE